jgi:hypothetical protein
MSARASAGKTRPGHPPAGVRTQAASARPPTLGPFLLGKEKPAERVPGGLQNVVAASVGFDLPERRLQVADQAVKSAEAELSLRQ